MQPRQKLICSKKVSSSSYNLLNMGWEWKEKKRSASLSTFLSLLIIHNILLAQSIVDFLLSFLKLEIIANR